MINDKKHRIYSLKSYNVNADFIKTKYEEYDINELVDIVESKNRGYHLRIHKNHNYVFFGDLDHYQSNFDNFAQKMIVFLQQYYRIKVITSDISYTKNVSKKGSYHYSIPTLYGSCEKLKEIHSNMSKILKIENPSMTNSIDTTIYSEHWFRLPNQDKGLEKNTEHKIIRGNMIDFIVEHIPEKSKCVDTTTYLESEKVSTKMDKNIDITDEYDKNMIMEENKIGLLSESLFESKHHNFFLTLNDLSRLIDILDKSRSNDYKNWLEIGMCLYNINTNSLYIWDKWSENSDKYIPNVCEQKWNTFKKDKNGLHIGSLLLWCKTDNESDFNIFMKRHKMSSMIMSKFPNDNLVLGKTTEINEDYSYTRLTNKECLIKGSKHDDMPQSMYLEMFKDYITVRCQHPECFGKMHPCKHIQLTKNEMNMTYIGQQYILANERDDEIIDFEKTDVFEDDILNNLVFNSLYGESSLLAEIVYYYYKNNYVYSEYDEWYVYKNHRWKNIGKKNMDLRHSVQPTLRNVYTTLINYYKKYDNDKMKIKTLKQIMSNFGNTISKNNIMVELAELYSINNNPERDYTTKLDSNRYLIGFTNGVYDLKTFTFRDGVKEDYITMSVGYDYNDKHTEKYDDLMKFLRDIQPNNDEFEYMMTYFSLCLFGNTLELFTILTGHGRNGKSKIIELLKITFGDYFGSVSSQIFTRPRPNADSPDPGLLNLQHKKVVIASEPEKNGKLNTGFIKFITGRDSTSLRNCHQNNSIDFSPLFITFLVCNDIPDTDDIDIAFSKRLRCVNFPTEFTENPIDKNQRKIDTNINENFQLWKTDFMLLLLQYYKKYIEKPELKPTEKINKWTNQYKENVDMYLCFLNEKTKTDPNEHTHLVELYSVFKYWFSNNNPGQKVPNNRIFATGLRKHKNIVEIKKGTKAQLGIRNLVLNED